MGNGREEQSGGMANTDGGGASSVTVHDGVQGGELDAASHVYSLP